MAQVSISINGRSYLISCDDGQEEHLEKLGKFIDGRMSELSAAVGSTGEARLLVMAALVIADELFEARDSQIGTRQASEQAAAEGLEELTEAEQAIAGALDAFAERIETIAAGLEGS